MSTTTPVQVTEERAAEPWVTARNELLKVRDQLRAEVERLTASSAIDRDLRRSAAERAERAEREVARLTEDRDGWKAKHWKAHEDFQRLFETCKELQDRAERAEAALQNCEITLGLNIQRANEARAELAKERARLNWLERAGKGRFSPLWAQDWIHIRSAIDDAMKEDSK